MKSLYDLKEQTWQFQATVKMTGVIRPSNEAKQCFLLLHGLSERGRRIYRKLLPALPDNSIIIAPNGPFPMPRIKENKMDMGYAWYVYDKFTQTYVIDQEMAVSALTKILSQNNPDNLPLTIIGFSQGGYLAPHIAQKISQTKLVLGLGCEFRSSFFGDQINYSLEAIHGSADLIISPESALKEIKALDARGIKCGWSLVEGPGHEINREIVNKVRELINQYGT